MKYHRNNLPLKQVKRIATGASFLLAVSLGANAQTSFYNQVNVAGSFNNFDSYTPNMTLVTNNIWQTDLVITGSTFQFKFSTENFANNWGLNSQPHRTLPQMFTLVSGGGDIVVTNPTANNVYRFVFNDSTRESAVYLINNLFTNLLFNSSFETTGNNASRARYWELNNPTPHGAMSGSGQRQGVAWGITPQQGAWVGLIAGNWSGSTSGSIWQETPAEPGLTYEASAWFQPEAAPNLWSATNQELRIEFYDFNRQTLLGAFTRNLLGLPAGNGTTNWSQQNISGLAPAGTAWARLVVNVTGAGPVGTFRMDSASLRAIEAKRTENFNDWNGATIDNAYTRGGWSIVTGRAVTSYVFASQSIPLARSGFAASLNNPTSSPNGSYVQSPRFDTGVGTVSFYYRHGYQGDPSLNPEAPVHLKVQRSFLGADFVTIGEVSNIVNTDFRRYEISVTETARFIRIVHAGGSTNRLLIDDISITPPEGQPRVMTFDTWTNAPTVGSHLFGGWRLTNGLVSSALALNGNSGQIVGNTDSVHHLAAPLFSNGYGTIRFDYRLGIASLRAAGFVLEASSGGTNWVELDRVTNITSASWKTYERFYIETAPRQVRIRNLAQALNSPEIRTSIGEGFDGGATNVPAGWEFEKVGTYGNIAQSGSNAPALRFDVTGASITTPGLVNPTNIRFMIMGQNISNTGAFQVEGNISGSWQVITTFTGIANSKTTWNIPVSTNLTQVRFTFFKTTGNLSFDDFIMQGVGFTNSSAPQTLLVDNVSIGNPEEFRLQDFNTWPAKTDFESGATFHQGWTLTGPVKVTDEKAFAGQAAQMTRTFGTNQAEVTDYVVDLEGVGETKTTYASNNVVLNGIPWNMSEALIGTSATDWKNGARSARLNGFAASSMTMLTNVRNVATVSFKYRRYGTDAQVGWRLQYSTNNGTGWINAGNAFTSPANDTVQTFTTNLNINAPVRIRIKRDVETGSTNRRLNIDDIMLTAISSGGGGGGSNSVITSHRLADGVGPISFQYRHFQNTAPSPAAIMHAAIQVSTNGVNWITTNTLVISNTSYRLYEQYLNLTNFHYARIAMTNGTGIALIDSLQVSPPQPPATVTISAWTDPALPFTNDTVILNAQVNPLYGANGITVTSFYRIGSTGAFTAIGMTPSAGTIYTATSAIPRLPGGAIVQYYIEARFSGPGSSLTSPVRFPENAPTSNAFYGIPRSAYGKVWINEVDHVGGFSDPDDEFGEPLKQEFIELAGLAGVDIGGWRVDLIDGSSTNPFVFASFTIPLNTIIPNDTNGYGFYLMGQIDLTNPVPDQVINHDSMDFHKPGAVFLYNEVGIRAHAIGYGGTAVGTGFIGVSDPDFPSGDLFEEPPTNSVSLTGNGTQEDEFSWGVSQFTPGSANIGQNFADPAVISPSTTLLTFNYIAGSYNPASQSLVISNAGTSAMTYTIAGTPSWIVVSPSVVSNLAGGATATHTVSIETAGLSGNRNGALTISGNAVNSPSLVNVQALETTVGSALLYYAFDEGSTIPAINGGTLGNAGNLSVTNGAGRTLEAEGVSARLGDFAYRSAVPTGLAVSASAVTGLNNRTQFTLTGWLKPQGGGASHQIIGNRGATNGFALMTDQTYGELMLVSSATGSPAAVSSTNGLTAVNDWTFFAVTFDAGDATESAVQFFGGSKTNGIVLNSSTNRGALGGTGASAAPLKVGGTGTNAYAGLIDDIRMFAGRLDRMTIEAVRQQGASRLTGSGEAPVIEQHPASQNLVSGQPLTLTVSASAIPQPQYQWRRFGTNLVGQTLSDFTISTPTAADAGSYDVVVFNAYGTITSETAILTLEGNIAIVTQPQSQLAYFGDTVQFGIVVTSTNATYQWSKNGTNISLATNAVLTIPNIGETNEAGYRVIATDATGAVTSQIATLTLVDVEFGGAGGGIVKRTGVPGMVITWPSIQNHVYDVLWSSNLMNGTHAFILVITNLPATPDMNVYTDTVYGVNNHGFYRIQSRQNQ